MIEKLNHVYPIKDLREHDTENGINCWCKPVLDEDYEVIVHNSMDEREKYETGERKIM